VSAPPANDYASSASNALGNSSEADHAHGKIYKYRHLPWTKHVLLFNSALTCRVGVAGSHAGCGWHDVTSALLRGLSEINGDVVYLCWGQPALRIIQKLKVSADVHGRIIASPHPSPLSAYRGFFGSKPFTRTNHLLAELNREPIDWQLP
jgi:uracil-DNA glycosylase